MELLRELEFRMAGWHGVYMAICGHIGSQGWGCRAVYYDRTVRSGSQAHPDPRALNAIYRMLATT